jgi:hypothetical protein
MMDDEAFVFAIAMNGRRWHVIPYAATRPNPARCGMTPTYGWSQLRSSLNPGEKICKRCRGRVGPLPHPIATPRPTRQRE